MMDLVLDEKQSKTFDCSSCDPGMQKIRNCNGKYGSSQSPMLVNGSLYRQCPRSFVIDSYEVGYLVSLYFDCRENKCLPFGTSWIHNTQFCKQIFDEMDERVSEKRKRDNAQMLKDLEKNKNPGNKKGFPKKKR